MIRTLLCICDSTLQTNFRGIAILSSKISSGTKQSNPSGRGSAGGVVAAAAGTSAKETQAIRRKRRKGTRRGSRKQSRKASFSDREKQTLSPTMYVSDRHVTVGNGFDEGRDNALQTQKVVSGGQTDANNTTRMKVHVDAREWFSSLSEDDRMMTLAFVDQSFLASIFQLVTTPSPGGLKPTTDGQCSKG